MRSPFMISLEGMYDIHVHPAPSLQKRKFTALEAVKHCSEEKMAGILFLDHTYDTASMVFAINELGYKTKAFGTVMLNESVGGPKTAIVEIALGLGAKQIQMPTYSSKGHQDAYGDDQKIFPYKKLVKPYYILDDKGRLDPEIAEIVQMVKGTDSFIGSGHLTVAELDVLVKHVKEAKCKMVINSVSNDMPGCPLDAQKRWCSEMVFIEHDYMAITDVPHETMPIETVVNQMRAVGAEYCVLGSDAGNMRLPDNVEAMRDYVTRLIAAGITEKEIDLMTRKNPSRLLGVNG